MTTPKARFRCLPVPLASRSADIATLPKSLFCRFTHFLQMRIECDQFVLISASMGLDVGAIRQEAMGQKVGQKPRDARVAIRIR